MHSKVCKEQMGTYVINTLMAEHSISVVWRSERKERDYCSQSYKCISQLKIKNKI